MMTDKELKQLSVAMINEAMQLYQEESYVRPPKKVIHDGEYHKLTRQQCVQGVIAFVHACNLSGGSMGNMDLYKLVYGYLTNPEAQIQINAIVKQHGI